MRNTAVSSASKCHIFSDNSAVVSIVGNLLANGFQHKDWIGHPDRDLITTTAKLLSRKPRGTTRITWVKARRDVSQATSTKDSWKIHHIAKADLAAKDALSLIPRQVSEIRQKMRKLLEHDATTRSNAALYIGLDR